MAEGRSIWRMIITNFIKSFKLLPPKGKLMGQDHLGNKYYEASTNKHSMRKVGNRWFEPKVGEDWQQNLPAEWEAIAQMKKIKGDEITSQQQAKSQVNSIDEKSQGFP
ncbi:mimitin, mitochondrial [Caerostris extrusa]|uniref:Mimitin, mitochondrial n=1 Tax=Caerostris extrusa TaxID=172846 RepID=A0AAV4YBB2_CAEEX|nr:mimitin, mitochondrial [Caerostris extrusa]